MTSSTALAITEFIKRVEALRKAGGAMTVANLFPDLAPRLSPALAVTEIGELFALDLLAVAPATWMRSPPVAAFEGDPEGLLLDRVMGLVGGLRDMTRVRMMVSEEPLFLLVTGLCALLGNHRNEARARIREFVGLEPQRILPAGSVSRVMFHEKGVFEAQVNAWTTSIHAIAEAWYLPLLRTAVDLAHWCRDRRPPCWREPVMLGGVMAAARRSWPETPKMNALLMNEVRIVRNARAHFTQDLDLDAETISFVTISRGQRRVLGPLAKTDVASIGAKLIETCALARSALEFVNDDEVVATFREHGLFTGMMRHLINPLAERSGLPTHPDR